MTAVRVGLAAALAVAGGLVAVPADAAVVRQTSAWTQTQDESVCGGEVVPVTFDGTMTVMSVGEGFSMRVRTALTWQQDGARYVGHATGGFSQSPSGRSSTYRIHGHAVGGNGVRVHIAEVVHAVWFDGEPQLRVEFERVTCR